MQDSSQSNRQPKRHEALADTEAPKTLQQHLVVIEVMYVDFSSQPQRGSLTVLDSVSVEVKKIFAEIYHTRFPIERMRPVSFYGWSDTKSVLANNTSGFNYRSLTGFPDLLSWHAFGLAIDINPLQNPATMPDVNGKFYRSPGRYDKNKPGTILADGPVVRAFLRYGWEWGGNYARTKKDYQHFEKPLQDDKRVGWLLEEI
jgi:peptidoglycan LD-endopeptidase CwlK